MDSASAEAAKVLYGRPLETFGPSGWRERTSHMSSLLHQSSRQCHTISNNAAAVQGFRQCGTHFIKDGREYKMQTKDLYAQAQKAGIDFKAEVIWANVSIV